MGPGFPGTTNERVFSLNGGMCNGARFVQLAKASFGWEDVLWNAKNKTLECFYIRGI